MARHFQLLASNATPLQHAVHRLSICDPDSPACMEQLALAYEDMARANEGGPDEGFISQGQMACFLRDLVCEMHSMDSIKPAGQHTPASNAVAFKVFAHQSKQILRPLHHTRLCTQGSSDCNAAVDCSELQPSGLDQSEPPTLLLPSMLMPSNGAPAASASSPGQQGRAQGGPPIASA
jgi:hypothetical protein